MEPTDQEYYRECDHCKELYYEEDGYSSLKNLKAACCSEECAELYDEDYDDE